MSKNLHPLVIEFFENRMAEHGAVRCCSLVPDADHVIYNVERKIFAPVRVLLSDEYFYSEFCYLQRPAMFQTSGFILVARPEATLDSSLSAQARADGVGLGKIGALMGALRRENYWEYLPPQRDNR